MVTNFKKTNITHALFYTLSIKTRSRKESDGRHLAAYDITFKHSGMTGSCYIWSDMDDLITSFEFNGELNSHDLSILETIKNKILKHYPSMIFSVENMLQPVSIIGPEEEDDDDDSFIEFSDSTDFAIAA